MPSSVEPLTAAELEDLTRSLLSDNINMVGVAPDSLSPQTWSTQQVYDALNFAIKEYCKATNASYMEREASLDGDGFASIPSAYLKVENVFYPSTALGSKPLYIRTNYPAAAVDKTAIYICKNNAIYLWDAVTGFEYVWSSLPNTGDGYTLDHLDISSEYLYAHCDHLVISDAIIHARAVYKIPLDGSSGWSLVIDFGWEDWAGVNGWWTTRLHKSLAFTSGSVYLTTFGQTDYVSSPLPSWRSQIIPNESSIAYSALRAELPLYYAGSDRMLLGGMVYVSGALLPSTTDVQRSGNTFDATVADGYTLNFGGYHWCYNSDAAGIHVRRATLVGNAGVGYTWSYDDHVFAGATLSDVPPTPFSDRSLIILSDGTVS